ncbi:MAG TPA: class I SAM-dependent methyltransferase [Allosphingosinicella sp.]|jgi:SAM-dependent methyltransferase|uniref:class I SAM-dependent methyltransferase n=1 Tax=Allosphingosinicella sp. TaxID=2823234 RepID=UPI002F2977A2
MADPELMRARYLAGQFARPRGRIGRWLIAPWLDRIAGPSNRLAFRKLDVRSGDRVLEVGFGGGGLLGRLLAAGADVVGADISEAMIARARLRFRREAGQGRLRLLHCSVDRLPLDTASIDKAVSVASLYFWPDPAAGIAELARVIRPGGRLVLCFEPAEELRKWPGHRFGFRLFGQEEVEALLEAAGFQVLDVQVGHGRKPDRFLCLSAERVAANG